MNLKRPSTYQVVGEAKEIALNNTTNIIYKSQLKSKQIN
jgi:hypothetical protein